MVSDRLEVDMLTPERQREISNLFLRYLLNKLGVSRIFPDGIGVMAQEMNISPDELAEFLNPYLREYFHPID